MRHLTSIFVFVSAAALSHAQFNTAPYGAVASTFMRGEIYSSDYDVNPNGLSASCFDNQSKEGDWGTVSASANAYANLKTGSAGGFASVNIDRGDNPYVMPNGTDAIATGTLWDTVTLTPNGGFSGRIPLRFALDGHQSNGTARVELKVYDFDSGKYIYNKTFGTKENKNFDTGIEVDPEVPWLSTRTLGISYSVTASAYASPYYDIWNSTADYSHTLKFGWDLPAGMSFTSASGVFKPGTTQSVDALNPVPEPASLAALATGAIALIRRRNRI